MTIKWLGHPYWGFRRWTQPARLYKWAFDIGKLRIARVA